MHRIKQIFAAGLVVLTSLPLGAASAAESVPRAGACFYAGRLDGWRALDSKTIYIRAESNRYYRLDLAHACSPLLSPDPHLINRVHGSDAVCSATDWDLQVSRGLSDIPEPCFVEKMTLLSPTEAAAIPRPFKP